MVRTDMSLPEQMGIGIRASDLVANTMDFMGVVKLYRDGRVEIAEGKTPDDAARAFWEAVQLMAPEFLQNAKLST